MAFGLVAASCTTSDFENVYGEDPHADFSQAFVQTFGNNIDPDHDWGFGSSLRGAAMRGVDANGNQWSQNWDVLPNVTPEERQKVLDAFNAAPLFAENEIILPFENYWVHQVYTGNSHYTANNNGDVLGASKMDKLAAYNAGSQSDPGNIDGHQYEHVNNFNAANNASKAVDEVSGYGYEGAMLMKDMNYDEGLTANNQFAFHCSEDSKYHFNYLILEIDGYYYVGFDFEATGQNPNQQVARDGRYTDWIVRISPAYPKGQTPQTPEWVRIIAEDLGSIGDFDYNDVVFDAYIDNAKQAHIILRAAGGTMPLYVGNVEVHEAFNVPTTTMVNTGVKGEINYNLNDGKEIILDGTYENVIDIPIIVRPVGKESYELTVTRGAAPEKIAVTPDYKWTVEYKNIRDTYPLFEDYVQNKDTKWY